MGNTLHGVEKVTCVKTVATGAALFVDNLSALLLSSSSSLSYYYLLLSVTDGPQSFLALLPFSLFFHFVLDYLLSLDILVIPFYYSYNPFVTTRPRVGRRRAAVCS